MLTTEGTINLERKALGEVGMLGRERWEEVHRRAAAGASIRRRAMRCSSARSAGRRPGRTGGRGRLPTLGAARWSNGASPSPTAPCNEVSDRPLAIGPSR